MVITLTIAGASTATRYVSRQKFSLKDLSPGRKQAFEIIIENGVQQAAVFTGTITTPFVTFTPADTESAGIGTATRIKHVVGTGAR